METKIKPQIEVTSTSSDETVAAANLEQEAITALPVATTIDEKWWKIGRKTGIFLEQLPTYISRFYQANKLSIISIALVFAAVLVFRVLGAVIDTINHLPFFPSILELIGIGYTAWFIYRYLLKAESRQELGAKIQELKAQIVGRNYSEPVN